MTRDELALAIERHATSKLPDDDLLRISTLGFRGRRCRRSAAKPADHHQPQGGRVRSLVDRRRGRPRARPRRTSAGDASEVRDLFFATPARLKFLKGDRSEVQQAVDAVQRLAMAHPDIAFHLTADGRASLRLPAAAGDLFQARLERVSAVIGREFFDNALEIDAARMIDAMGRCA